MQKIKMTNSWLPIGLVIVIVLLVVCFAYFKGYRGDSQIGDYKIGTLVPLTGSGASLGTPMLNGMELAAEEINNTGGINGKKISVVAQDSKLDGQTSVSAANFLLNVEKPDIYTILFHLPAQSVATIIQNNKKPFIYEAFTRSIVNENTYAFKANFDALDGCEKIVKYAKDNNKYRNLGVVLANGEYGDLCINGIKKVETRASIHRYEFGETDFRTILTKAKNDGVDKILFIGVGIENVNMFKQLSDLNYPIKLITLTASESIYPDVIKVAKAETLEGTLSIDFIPSNIANTEFAKKYLKKYPSANFVDFAYGAVGYEEMQYISEALRQANTHDAEKIKNALEKVKNYNSVLGSHGFINRVLQLDTEIYEFTGGNWKLLQ